MKLLMAVKQAEAGIVRPGVISTLAFAMRRL
jgi:hypothetical protein